MASPLALHKQRASQRAGYLETAPDAGKSNGRAVAAKNQTVCAFPQHPSIQTLNEEPVKSEAKPRGRLTAHAHGEQRMRRPGKQERTLRSGRPGLNYC